MHEELCKKPLMSGKRTYVDKTFAPDQKTAKAIFEVAEAHNTPCYSTSALRFASEYEELKRQNIQAAAFWGPYDLETYSIHQLEPMSMLMQGNVKRVLAQQSGGWTQICLEWSDGRAASLTCTGKDGAFWANVGLEQEKVLALLDGIYSTVVIRDILERETRRGQKQITDPALLRKIILFLADNIGSSVSIASIGNILVNEGLLDDDKRKGIPSAHTVQAYVNALLESYFFYEIKRFDIKGKAYLRTLGKYYIVDIGLRNYLLGFRNRDSGHAIENVVYFELLRRGYDVAIGKIGNGEVDFIATTADEKKYIQVTESMMSEDVRKRELAPLQSIRDNYEKIVLSLEPGLDTSYDGIKSENLIDWLLNE